MRAAVDDSTRRMPIRRCSVPTYWWSIDSASCAAYARIFFDSSESGSSAEEEMRSKKSARRAFSLYFSNIGLVGTGRLHFKDPVAASGEVRVVRHDNGCQSSF